MFDELNNTAMSEIEAHGANHSQEVVQEAPIVESEKTEKQFKTDHDLNWRLMRDRAEAAERRAKELERAMMQNQPQQKIQLVEEDEDDIDISDDSYIEGKQLKKYVKTLKKELKATKQQFQEVAQRTALEQAEFKLKTQFNDFDAVVTKDNLEKLAMVKPSLYRSVLANQDIYDRGYTAYEMIKAAGLASDDYSHQERRIEENRSKPKAAANVSPQSNETPLARAGDYDRRIISEERRRQILRNVEEAKRNRV